MPRLLLDLSNNNKGGFRTAQGLVPAMEVVLAAHGATADYVLPEGVYDEAEEHVRGRVHRLPSTPRGREYWTAELALPRLARSYDLLFTYREHLRLPRRRRWKLVVQVHEHPSVRHSPSSSLTRSLLGALEGWRAGTTHEQAERLTFSSEWTRQEFVRFASRDGEVLPLSGWPDQVADHVQPVPASPHVVMMASADTRDAVEWGLEAWRAAGLRAPWTMHVVGRLRSTAPVPPGVEQHGWLEDADLLALMSSAAAYVHIGQVEGFGIPVLEALQLGVPVVAPRTSALPELLTGGGGRLVTSADEAGAALREVVADDTVRAEALAAGSRYRWRSTAERLWDVLEDVAGAQ